MISIRSIRASSTSIAAKHGLSDSQYAEIIRLWHRGKDTFDIGKATDLHQSIVERVLHAAREQRRRS